MSMRIEQNYRKKIPILLNPNYRWDARLGWVGKEHLIGHPDSQDITLVLGDSFTDGLTVPSDKMWFSYLLEDSAAQRLIAYGGQGYGTLQEKLVIEDYIAKGIKPTRIILQLCSNDFINNYRPLEEKSLIQRAPAPRPYLENGKISVQFPRAYDFILYPLISVSRLAFRYNNRWDEYLAKQASSGAMHTIETDIQTKGFKSSLFRASIPVTQDLLQQIISSVSVPIILMLIDNNEPYSSAFKGIAKNLKIPLFIPSQVEPLPANSRLTDGAHLNELGNRIVGTTLNKMINSR